jgi:hypothetical protein
MQTRLWLLRRIPPIFMPSIRGCTRHNFRHLGVGQQYPTLTRGTRNPSQRPPLQSLHALRQARLRLLLARFTDGLRVRGPAVAVKAWGRIELLRVHRQEERAQALGLLEGLPRQREPLVPPQGHVPNG